MRISEDIEEFGGKISVIITTYNRGEVLRRVFKGWLKQTLRNFEMVIVDDGSTDDTYMILEEAKRDFEERRPDVTFKIYRQENRGPAGGRNFAVTKASGDILVFVDDDAYPVKDFLKAHLLWHDRYPNAVVRGPVINVSSWERVSDKPPKGILSRIKHYSRNYFCTANASVRKELFTSIGGFDESFKRWSDTEFAYRLRGRYKLKWIFDFNATVYHYKPEDLFRTEEELRRHYYREGVYAAKLFLRYPDNIWVKLRTGYFFPNIILWNLLRKDGNGIPFLSEGRAKRLRYFIEGFLDTIEKEGGKLERA